MGKLTAIVLGSAAGGAFPQWNCRCSVCALAWAGDTRVKPRTQASLAVSADRRHWTLINASPDLGVQIRATAALHPQGNKRDTPVAAVVLTGAEIDQIAGLAHLRENAPFVLHATAATHAALSENVMFDALRAVTRRAVAPGTAFALPGGLEAELFIVPGKTPLYLEDPGLESDTPQIEESAGNTGVELRADSKRLLFIPGAAAVTPAMRARMARADTVLFDGTLFTDDEMIREGVGEKTGLRMGHLPVDGDNGTLAQLADVKARRVFVHINNTNPMLIEGSPQRAKAAAAGWEVAEDGMEIVL